MSNIAISVQNISKKYIIGQKKSTSLSENIVNSFKNIKKSDQKTEEFLALKDVSFEINKGEAVGIIGRNGAGKSTLLKILSRITMPTKGRFELNGRVSSLLEVGTGFHPELTGRENIFLNGTILGMKRNEIVSKFDEIVDFSGIEKFLDTPVKRYSSGMYVRLAFAVAAHLEPEILIIDEVLAVGDAEFQKKCLGKMNDVSSKSGQTVIFVSHNMNAIQNLCQKTILLANGSIHKYDLTSNVIQEYQIQSIKNSNTLTFRKSNEHIEHVEVNCPSEIAINESITITINIESSQEFLKTTFFILILNQYGETIGSSFSKDGNQPITINRGMTSIDLSFNNSFLPGRYNLSIGAFDKHNDFVFWAENSNSFDVKQSFANGKAFDGRLGMVNLDMIWK